MRRTLRRTGSPAFLLLGLAAAVVGSLGQPNQVDARSDPPPLAASPGSGSACTFAILADNTLTEHEVEIRFLRSSVIVQRANFFSTDIDLEDRVLAPGENLNVRYEAPGSCGAPRNWYFAVGIGTGGSDIMIEASTEGEADRDIHLGDSSCWAKYSDWGRRDTKPNPVNAGRRGCDVESDENGGEERAPTDGDRTQPEEAATVDREEGDPENVQEREGWISADLLVGDWVRVHSNNPRNNGMRVRVVADADGVRATLTALPPTAASAFRVGQVLWTEYDGSGTLNVRGSDGGYYSASFTITEGAENRYTLASRLDIDVDHNGRGNDQTWERAGPSIDGDWVLVDSYDPELDDDFRGLQVRVEGDRAAVDYVTAVAATRYRTGEEFWRGIEGKPPETEYDHGEGTLEYRETASRRWLDMPFSLTRSGLLVVGTGEEYQVWARPDEAEEMMTAAERGDPLVELPAEPPRDPDAAGGDLERPAEERTVDVPEELPPPAPEPEEEAACLSTSLADDGLAVSWGWEIEAQVLAADASAPRTEAGVSESRHERHVGDLDRSYAPGVLDHFASIAFGDTNRRTRRDLTASELENRNQTMHDEGYRLTDLEGYTESGSVRYAAVWSANPEDVTWASAFGLTDSEYHAFYSNQRAAGFRLVDLEAYATPDGLRYAGIWHRSCDNSNWRQFRNLTEEQFEARSAELSARGFNIVDFESYETDRGQRYGAIWETVPSRAWTVVHDQDLKWFLNHHRRYTDTGYRLIDYESYRTSDGIRYAGVWAENAPRFGYEARVAIDDSVRSYLRANDLPGISIVIIQDGDVVYRRGFGFADTAQQKWAHAETVYLLASVSKVIGATLAARMEERSIGNLDLGTETGAYLPAAAYHDGRQFYIDNCFQGNDVLRSEWDCQDIPSRHTHTLEQLLSKTGCTSHYREGREPDQSKHYRWRVEALGEISRDSSLLNNCTPGMHYRYSTHGFTYVGAALEAAAQKDIAELLQDEIARPLGLSSLRAMYASDGHMGYPADYDRATPYKVQNPAENSATGLLATPPHPQQNPSVPAQYWNSSWKVLGGGVEAHALDLARFGWGVLDGQIVSATTRDARLWSSRTGGASAWVDNTVSPSVTPSGIPANGVGLAWVLGGSLGSSNGRWVRHGGDWIGAGAYLKIWRDRDLVIAMLSNRRHHEVRFRNPFLDGLANVVLAATPP